MLNKRWSKAILEREWLAYAGLVGLRTLDQRRQQLAITFTLWVEEQIDVESLTIQSYNHFGMS